METFSSDIAPCSSLKSKWYGVRVITAFTLLNAYRNLTRNVYGSPDPVREAVTPAEILVRILDFFLFFFFLFDDFVWSAHPYRSGDTAR